LYLLKDSPFANTGSWSEAKAGTGPFSPHAGAMACADP
jgi:hypothetical protein